MEICKRYPWGDFIVMSVCLEILPIKFQAKIKIFSCKKTVSKHFIALELINKLKHEDNGDLKPGPQTDEIIKLFFFNNKN